MSSLAQRRCTAVLGSKRWWQGGCWATRGHQEAYLRKLYGRKNESRNREQNDENDAAQPRDFQSLWTPDVVYNLSGTDERYLDAFLGNRDGDANDDIDAAVVDCLALATSRASPTEKCVEFLKGAHDDGNGFTDNRPAAEDAKCGRAIECDSTVYDTTACSE